MKGFRRFFTRLGNSAANRQNEERMKEEIAGHIALQTEENLRAGMNAVEARRQAMLKFGGVEAMKEEYRDERRLMFFETLAQDIRFGLRMLAKSPAFAAIAILTLALGIGANTAIFSLVDAVILRSLPVENAKQLALLQWSARKAPNIHGYQSAGDCADDLRFGAQNPTGCSFSEPMFREIAQSNLFAATGAFTNTGRLNLTGNGTATVIDGQVVSGEFFRTLGIKAAIGRLIDASDDQPTATPVAVLNYGYWQSAFGGSREVIGRVINLNNVPFTIVGVAEARFNGLTPGSDYEVWLPLADAQRIIDPLRWRDRKGDVRTWWLTIVGRVKAESPWRQTQAAVSGLFRNEMLHGGMPLFHDRPELRNAPAKTVAPARHEAVAVGGAPPREMAGEPQTLSTEADNPEVRLVPAQAGLAGTRGEYTNSLYVLMLAVGIILLIASANVAGLLLARAAARQKEMAVRLALGAGRGRVVRQLLTESVMLSALGGLLGVFFAYWGAQAIVSFVASNQARPLGFVPSVDRLVLGFTVAISLGTGILFGIVPAFRGVRVNLTPTLKEGAGSSASVVNSQGTWLSAGNALVVVQMALAIVVLVGAGLLVRTLANLRHVDIGFDSENIVIFSIDPTLVGYKGAQVDSFYRDLQGRLAETPGVKSASYSMMPLLGNGMMITLFHWPGTPEDQQSESDVLGVGPKFFETLHIPFLRGRGFEASDFQVSAANGGATPSSTRTPVIVNQAFVEKYLGKEDALGKQFGEAQAGPNGPANPGYEIVGVVRDTKYNDLRREIHAMMFMPQNFGGATFELRTAAEPQAILPAIRERVAQVSTNLPLYDVRTEARQIDRLLFQERLTARLAGFFGVLALVLACIGLYGLLSYEVARRTREIGIRMALGAGSRSVLKLVLRQGIALAAVGAAVGIGVALGVTRYLAAMLYDVHPNDPVTLIAVAVLLVLVALAACYIPARRATRVDPMVALRYE